MFAAALPAPAGEDTYSISLKVHLAVAHYHLGLPFKRIESYQDLVGLPLPDATQWELVEQVADSAYPVYEELKTLGAQQHLVYQDDTGARLLSLIKENRADPPPERKGMYTTVLQFEGAYSICLYFTGRRHAGENLDAILALRDPDLAPIQWMSDGLAANTPKQHRDQALDINCLTHGRRKLVELEAFFPHECTRVIDAITAVYQHEAHCKEHALNATQRLAYHQAHSRAVMDDLKAWMEQQFEDRCVEPNSRLGEAFNYLLKRWEALTRFLAIPGAPLGRVEVWRGGLRYSLSVSASFVWRCLNSRTIAPFPHPARRTRRADFPQRALFQGFKPSHSNGWRASVTGVSVPILHRGTGRSIGGTPFPACRAYASTRSAHAVLRSCRYGGRYALPAPG